MTLNEIRAKGYAALLRELGPTGYVRFLQQFESGEGNYTEQRHQWLDAIDAEQIKAMIADRQKQQK